ncbi:MAG: ABC transporter ATP-binding protein [Burkholderiales bacterium]
MAKPLLKPILRSERATSAPVRAKPYITVRHLRKAFQGNAVYEDFDIDIPRHSITSVFGPNGCGKSTLINLISGLLPLDGGQILFDGLPREEITIGYVFQNYRDSLFPWLRSRDNIAYPLLVRGHGRAKAYERVEELAAEFSVGFNLDLYPYKLSGGQQQLVSILRALAARPEVIFLDEPFSALDFEMTMFVREVLQAVHLKTGVTMVVVSHDLAEAILLADELVLLSKRPARIAASLPVPLARPRGSEDVSSPAFAELHARALAIFREEARRQL